MGLSKCPKSHVLFADMSTETKMGFIAKENEVENSQGCFQFFQKSFGRILIFLFCLHRFVVGEFVSCRETMLSLCV